MLGMRHRRAAARRQRVIVPDDVQAEADALHALDPLQPADPLTDPAVVARQVQLDAARAALLAARDRGEDLDELLALSREVGAAELARWVAVERAGGELPVEVADELQLTRHVHRHPVLLPD